VRRPSLATVIALLALFVALGGPAEAARLIGSAGIKDRSIKERDIKRSTVRSLKTPRNGSVTAGKLATGAVGSAALADRSVGMIDLGLGAVGSAEIRDGAIRTAAVADGSLGARDIARFYGRFSVSMPAIAARTCWAAEPTGLAAERAGADISQDFVGVTPGSFWPDAQLSFTVSSSADPRRFVLTACNPTSATVPAVTVSFRYVVIDLP
jgi:hypothetical protein